jgi:hypothetical protein
VRGEGLGQQSRRPKTARPQTKPRAQRGSRATQDGCQAATAPPETAAPKTTKRERSNVEQPLGRRRPTTADVRASTDLRREVAAAGERLRLEGESVGSAAE